MQLKFWWIAIVTVCLAGSVWAAPVNYTWDVGSGTWDDTEANWTPAHQSA